MNNMYYADTSKSLTVGKCEITKNISLTAHFHKQIEIVYVLNGGVSLYVNNHKYCIKKNEFAVIRSLDIHSFSVDQKDTTVFLLILPDIYSINLSDVNVTSQVFHTENDDIKKIVEMYTPFQALSDKYMLIYYQMFYEAIKSLYVFKADQNETIQNKILKYINAHFNEQLTLNAVALACNTNRSYVSRTINEYFSISFTQYVNRLRISSFLDIYLKNNQTETIEDIAARVGFVSIRTFYRSFQREFNCTPTEYLHLNPNPKKNTLFD